MMTRTAEQCCVLVEAIAVASSVAGLDELRQDAQRELGLDVHGSFLELLIKLRQEKLARKAAAPARTA